MTICPDCNGTGVYVGLGTYPTEPCRTCADERLSPPLDSHQMTSAEKLAEAVQQQRLESFVPTAPAPAPAPARKPKEWTLERWADALAYRHGPPVSDVGIEIEIRPSEATRESDGE